MDKQEALAELRRLCPPGAKVYTVLRHVSRSGMTRAIEPFVIEDGAPRPISFLMVKLGGWKFNRTHGGITVGGAGMDMGFHLVYSLSRTLYPEGFECVGMDTAPYGCPSNDHSNGDRDYTPHPHSDGGYALRQEWF